MSPFYALGTMICLLFCGLSLDIGLLELQRTQMQTAADAAATAAELQFERGASATGSDDGKAAAASHGFVDGSNGTTVSYVTNNLIAPASGGDYDGHYDAIQVLISRQVTTLFMGLVNGGKATVSTTSVSSMPPCQYFLGTKNLVLTTVDLELSDGTPYMYSSCPAYVNGTMNIPLGGWWQANQSYVTAATSLLLGRVKSGVSYNSVVRPDPLAALTQPTAGSCTYTNYSSGNYSTTTAVVLNPGTYCGSVNAGVVTPGLTLINDNVTVNPGLYVITGGANWERATMTGSGVTFFFTKVGTTTSYGSVYISDLSNLTLYAAGGSSSLAFGATTPSGAIAGVLYFLDRNWVNTTSHDFNLNSSASKTSGVWYLPYTGLTMFNGSQGCYTYCGIVADNLYQTNWELDTLGMNFSSFAGGNPFRQVSVLVQ